MNNRTKSGLVAIAACLLVVGQAHAATYYVSTCGQDFWAGVQVGCAGPLGPKRTVQAAINAASNGDVITVLPGVYVGTIDLDGKAVRITGAAGAAATILDGDGAGPVITCNSFEGPGTIIEGLTIRGGRSALDGAGMLIGLASPIVRECVFDDNRAERHGGAISAALSSVQIIDCEFTSGRAGTAGGPEGNGGAVYLLGGSPTITGCTFSFNLAQPRGGAVFVGAGTTASIDDCDFVSNWTLGGAGGALSVVAGTAALDGCVFDGNTTTNDGAGAAVENGGSAQFNGCDFLNNTFVKSGTRQGAGVWVHNSEASFLACGFENNTAGLGGAIYASGSEVGVVFCGFDSNEVTAGIVEEPAGGAVYAVDSDVEIGLSSFSANSTHGHGGALALMNGVASVDGCAFTSNECMQHFDLLGDGGAIWGLDASLSIDGCTFTENVALHEGGGVSVEGAVGQTEIVSSSFLNNAADIGGGLRFEYGTLHVTDCDFEGNTANFLGAGASCFQGDSRFDECVFIDNSATSYGGGLSAAGNVTAVGCLFFGNSSEDGGGVVTFSSNHTRFIACEFEGNSATVRGSALSALEEVVATLVNCIVTGNTAGFGVAAVQTRSDSGATELEVINTVVANNVGGGVVVEPGIDSAIIANSIVRSNTSGPEVEGAQLSVFHSNIEGGWAGEGNIDANPMFINAAVGNYRLQPGSPCVDAGVNARVPLDFADIDGDANTSERTPLDYDGNPRFMDDPAAANLGCGAPAIVDMGPFERAGAVAPMLPFADLNGDGVVNASDLAILLGAWGPCMTGCCPGDLNLDGQVNASDLAMLLGAWS